MSVDDGMKLVDAWMAEQQVRAFDNALGIDWQSQTSIVTGLWSNGAFNVTPGYEVIPGRTTPQNEQERSRVMVAEPGSQAPYTACWHCSCRKTVARKDAMRMHHRGITVFLEDDAYAGQGPMCQGMQQT
jgi:hypothetical protein